MPTGHPELCSVAVTRTDRTMNRRQFRKSVWCRTVPAAFDVIHILKHPSAATKGAATLTAAHVSTAVLVATLTATLSAEQQTVVDEWGLNAMYADSFQRHKEYSLISIRQSRLCQQLNHYRTAVFIHLRRPSHRIVQSFFITELNGFRFNQDIVHTPGQPRCQRKTCSRPSGPSSLPPENHS